MPRMMFGSGPPTDAPFPSEPPSITMLYFVEAPPFGGGITWANAALAYSMPSDTYCRMIDGLNARFSMRDVLKSAHEAVELSDNPIGRLRATRDSQQRSDGWLLKARGNVPRMGRAPQVTGLSEHGIGLVKKDFRHLSRRPAEIALMRAIKKATDPNGLLNPGKIF